ncbi:MFS transporter [Gemmata sp.]|uniref:MFS transporter n=1 Tax=Gemmata sp. TaxID=1914242 RepID=UPI003F72EEDE
MPNRYLIVGVTAAAALLLYVDRVCISILADPIRADLGLAPREKEVVLSAFFLTYALFQIPVGALADRFGPRLVLTASIVAWSAVTALTGLAWSFGSLLSFRLLLGLSEAGAYPAAAVLVERWARPGERGRFNAIVIFGGRVGGAFAPALTTALGRALVGAGVAGAAAGESGVNWRGVFVLYGACGLGVALLFWAVVRDRPPAGPGPGPPPAPVPPVSFRQVLRLVGGNRGMWHFGALQFCVNVSWVLLVTLLPSYLRDAGVEIGPRATIQTGVLLAGCAGMLVGGFLTDAVRRRLGPRWGRSAPLSAAAAVCALACAAASTSPGLRVVVAALAVTSLCVDMALPSVWAYAQDVAGSNAGAAVGFGNMLANLGAAASPLLLGAASRAGGWEGAFALCALCYAAAALLGLFLDASRPLGGAVASPPAAAAP